MVSGDLQSLLSCWPGQCVLSGAPVRQGNSTAVYPVLCDGEQFLLRLLPCTKQAEREAAIAGRLFPAGLGAQILPTRDGRCCALWEGRVFHLQRLLPGKPPSSCTEAIAAAAGSAVARMQTVLRGLTLCGEAPDQFDPHRLWDAAKDRLSLLFPLFPGGKTAAPEEAFFALLSETAGGNDLLHGDLGIWNMLEEDGRIRLIDFGECRRGNFLFDAAAALSSLLALEKDDCRARACADAFVQSCAPCGVPVGRDSLLPFLRLWSARGILAALALRKKEGVPLAKKHLRHLLRVERLL